MPGNVNPISSSFFVGGQPTAQQDYDWIQEVHGCIGSGA
jgi:hypothetical protein